MSAREVRKTADVVRSAPTLMDYRVGDDVANVLKRVEYMARHDYVMHQRNELNALQRENQRRPSAPHVSGPGQVVCPKCNKPTFSETTAYASGMMRVTRWKCRPCFWISEPSEI